VTANTAHSVSRGATSGTQDDADRAPPEISAASILKGEESDFIEAFRAFATPLIQFACRIVYAEAVAQDIVMDVFLKLWRKRESLPPDLRLEGYLYTAVRNAALDALAHARVEQVSAEQGIAEGWTPGMGTPGLSPDALLERAEAKEALRRAYDALPTRLRQVIGMRWFEGRSYQEIALELRISVKSVDNYLAKAMRLLREALGNQIER